MHLTHQPNYPPPPTVEKLSSTKWFPSAKRLGTLVYKLYQCIKILSIRSKRLFSISHNKTTCLKFGESEIQIRRSIQPICIKHLLYASIALCVGDG